MTEVDIQASAAQSDDPLRRRLAEAEATLDAIRAGRVDALVVEGNDGQQVYMLESADLPYQRFLEQMAEGAVSLDANNAILFCNRFFCELLGLPRERVLGSSFEEFLAPEQLPAYRAALRADGARRFGSALRVGRGELLPVQLGLTPSGSGSARRYTLVVTDLSERERLSAAREAVEAESLAKDRFLAALGHELRGPLNVIMGWSTLLMEQRGKLDAREQKAIEAIDRNAKLQHRLIEDMIDVARVASGKLRLAELVVDLGELVQATGASMLLGAHEKGVSLDVRVSGSAAVMGDAQRLEQMLQNLLGNAIKFTPTGGHVVLTLERTNSSARIIVQDDGRGIEPGMLPLIFQPFRQAHGDNLGQRGGLGLGLTITKQIVELHAGRIQAHSQGAGRGACFVVELPLYQGNAASAREVGLAGLRILVVDDEEDVRELTTRTLLGAGAEVVCVDGAESALARLEDQPFDAVVSDLLMPGTDGWDFAREVRQRYGSSLALLALSGAAGTGVAEAALRDGYGAVLQKPAAPGELLRALRELLWVRT